MINAMKKANYHVVDIETYHDYPNQLVHELFTAILAIKNKREAANFFRDLLTMAELTEFANRWQMVKLLIDGKPYLEIAAQLHTSTATVTRVARWLFHGRGGYKLIAERLYGKTVTPKPENTA